MNWIFTISLPFTNPIEIFATILLLVLIAPILFRKLKIPGIVGLIISGVLVGPHGLNLLSEEIGFSIFGTFGLLYLMFLAGLEIDFKDFKRNRKRTLLYGLLTFGIPFAGGYFFAGQYLSFGILASVLIGAMLASHTLVSYPIIGKYGIKQQQIVTIIIGATIVADTLALIVLGLVSDLASANSSLIFWLKTTLYYALFFGFVLWLIPIISKWFFSHSAGDNTSEYVFVLVVVFATSMVAELLKIEPIIGAFFAGLALNRLIVRTSPLMNRIVFIGESLFIPFFLISVGMLVDPKSFVANTSQLTIALLFLAIAVVSKWLAAYVFQKIGKYSWHEGLLAFSLTNSRAASAIAIILVGYNLELVDESIVNITVMIILFSCIISSFLTQYSAKHVAIQELDKLKPGHDEPEKILVPVANPDTMEHLLNFSLLIKNENSEEPVFPLSIVPDDETATENVKRNYKILESAVDHAASMDQKVEVISRVDLNIGNGIARAAKEMMIDKIVVGWNDKVSTVNYFFGTLLANLLKKTGKMICVLKVPGNLSLVNRIIVIVPPNFECEIGFSESLMVIKRLSKQLSGEVVFLANETTIKVIQKELNAKKPVVDASYNLISHNEYMDNFPEQVEKFDLIVIFKARKNTISFYKSMDNLPSQIAHKYQENNLAIIYPEQEELKLESYIM
ncbi:MAG: cation:proton antiporter [Bacteroidetes bacterium]|jgi:Kef-type K+ transport system membrane component KefB|nr:cation:proton antiporter [Bacteroidota bacterium]